MRSPEMTMVEKIRQLNWGMAFLIALIAAIGFAALYSAAGGRMDPWAGKHLIRFGVCFLIMLAVALTDIRIWLRFAYVFYAGALLMLLAVDVMGVIGMGARRWLDIGVMQLQPSELMKVGMVLAMARYFHSINFEEIGSVWSVLLPVAFIVMPVALVMVQPDLGTAMMLVFAGGAIMFVAGVRLWKFAVAIVAAGALLPIGWSFLREYQRNRLLTFIDPERDPLGTGYHILQSKIAFGSGGVFGKGYMFGSQAYLNFLPEKQTDFIFTMLAEEFGMVGAGGLMALFACVLLYGFAISLRARNHFGRLLAIGICITLFLYVFINIGMVMGVLPVVGVPLPLVSFGGTAMLTTMIAVGLLMSVYIHRDTLINRAAASGL